MLMLGSCKNHSLPERKPVITVSIEPQRWLLERIVGDRMKVRTLMARGGNPESYEPSFSHLADMESSYCYMMMGNLAFEHAIIDRISANLPNLPIVNNSDSITLIVDDPGHDHGVDPHVWSSAANARIIAANMLREVIRLDQDGERIYRRNYRQLVQTIDSVDSVCAHILAPLRGSTFIVWHPSLSYFARDYGLRQLSVGSEGKDHSVLNTRDVLRRIGDERASVFLVQQDVDATKAAAVVGGVDDLRVETINPLNYDWSSELLHIANAIAGR